MAKKNNNNNTDIFTKTKKLEERINELTFRYKSAKGIIDELIKRGVYDKDKEADEKLRKDFYTILGSVYGRALNESFEKYFGIKKLNEQIQKKEVGFLKHDKKNGGYDGTYS